MADQAPEPRYARIQGDHEECGRCGHLYHKHQRPETPLGPMPCSLCDCVDLRP